MNQSKSSIYFEASAEKALRAKLHEFNQHTRRVFWLVDEHTKRYCLPGIKKKSGISDDQLDILEIPSGEINKNLVQAGRIWEYLTHSGANRDAVLIILGGGMLCDLGGFAASVYQRGIETLYIPTTLLAMVDAAIGGKTGIDFLNLKNQIGNFHFPTNILIFTHLLQTLPKREYDSALPEVIKYGYISRPDILDQFHGSDLHPENLSRIIRACIREKLRITKADPMEKGLRKLLNFGHTLGHAIESTALSKGIDLLHGEAVAAGLACELWLSVRLMDLDQLVLETYISFLKKHFGRLPWIASSVNEILIQMRMDKKNSKNRIRTVLITKPGYPVYDVSLNESDILESLHYYSTIDFG